MFCCPTLSWSFGHHMPPAGWWVFPECCNFFRKECLEFFVWCRGEASLGPRAFWHTSRTRRRTFSMDLTSPLFILPLSIIQLLQRSAYLPSNAQKRDIPAHRMSTEPKRRSRCSPFERQRRTLSAVRLSVRHLAVVRDTSWHSVFHSVTQVVLAWTWAWSYYGGRSKVTRPLTQLYCIIPQTLWYLEDQCVVVRDF